MYNSCKKEMIMSQAALVTAQVPSYGTNPAAPVTTSAVRDLTPDLSKKSLKELAVFIGKVALVAIIVVGLASACLFTGGLAIGAAAAGMGAGLAFLKCFALSAAALATGGAAGMLFIGTAMKITDKIRGKPEEETNKRVTDFYAMTSVGIAAGSLILSLGGILLLPFVGSIYEIVKSKEEPKSEDVATNFTPAQHSAREQRPVLQIPEVVAQPAAVRDLPVPREPTAVDLHYDLLLSLTQFDLRQTVNQSRAKEALGRCTEDFRNGVYGQIWELNGRPETSDAQWGQTHAFDNAQILEQAIKNVYLLNKNIL